MIYSFVVSFILGIAFENFFHFGWSAGILVFFISLILSALFWKEKNLRIAPTPENFPPKTQLFLIMGLAFALGILRIAFTDTSSDQNFLKFAGQKISFEAIISDEPDMRDLSTRYTVNPINSKSFILLITDCFPELEYGDKVRVSGKLELPKNFENDNDVEFDYISYLSKDKIHFLIYHPQVEKLAGREGNKIASSLYFLKNIFTEKIKNVVPEPNSSLLGGIIFGAKQSLGQELLNDFKKAGLIHIVVLSGYNITVIAVGIFYLTSFLGKRKLGFAISAISIVLFSIMVGLGATVIRACIMSLISILAVFLGRPADALRWLFIAGFLMLLWNPLILFYDPSFQLSFMATLGLILFSPAVDRFLLSPVIRFLLKIKTPASLITGAEKLKLREIISSTLAVQLFVLPLLIKMSGFASLVSFVVNPIILPLVPWAMGFGALTGAVGLLPFIGQILSWPFGIISYLITQMIISTTEFSARLPFATLQTGNISLWPVFIWYLGYGFLFLKLKNKIVSL